MSIGLQIDLINEKEFNFADNRTSESDRERIFEDEKVYLINTDTTLEYLMSDVLKKFSSRSQARKNGWSGPIPKGYKEYKFGKYLRFYTWMPPEFWFSLKYEWLREDREKYPGDYDESGNPILWKG